MNFCIDIGNTCTKLAIFQQDEMLKNKSVESSDWQTISTFYERYTISNTIISSVGDIDAELIRHIESCGGNWMLLNHRTEIPVRNMYQTPETLGKDRLAAVIGAFSLKPEQDVLVIDAGTAITFDFINRAGVYAGGSISPGLQMRFSSLHANTKKLPQVLAEGSYGFPANTTEEAIRTGIIQGIVYEMDGYINSLKKSYPELLIFLTGGDCFFFESKLKNTIFANQNLVLIGLNRIINYNVRKI